MAHGGSMHAGMDMGGMGGDGMMGNMSGNGTMTTTMPNMHMMHMYFTTKWMGTYILFEEWMLMKTWHLVIACICIGIVAALYEGLKVFREHLLRNFGVSRCELHSEGSDDGKGKGDVSFAGASNSTVRARMCTWLHFLQTFLHMVQVTVSYLLMLVVMTFNVWLGLSVILGAGLGYFLFGWKRAVIVDSNEHCH